MARHIASIGRAALSGLALVAAAAAPALADKAEPFKQTNIHFETNASACDMGIQMSFDTEGITTGQVESPDGTGRVQSAGGLRPGRHQRHY